MSDTQVYPGFATPMSTNTRERECPDAPWIRRTRVPVFGEPRPRLPSSPLSSSRTAHELDEEPVTYDWDTYPAVVPASPTSRRATNMSSVVRPKKIPTVPDFSMERVPDN